MKQIPSRKNRKMDELVANISDYLSNSSSATLPTATNTTTNTTAMELVTEYGVFTKEEAYAIITTYSFMAVLGLILNSLTICIVSLGDNTSKEIKVQLVNLAVADLLMAVLDPARYIIQNLRLPFSTNLTISRFAGVLGYTGHYASLLCNVAISLERFFVVFFPFRASRYTRSHKLIVIGVVWVCAALPGVENILYTEVVEYGRMFTCSTNKTPSIYACSVETRFLTLKYVLPALVIVTVYMLVFIKLCLQKTSSGRRHLAEKWRKDLGKVCISFVYKNIFNNMKQCQKNTAKLSCGFASN